MQLLPHAAALGCGVSEGAAVCGVAANLMAAAAQSSQASKLQQVRLRPLCCFACALPLLK